MKVARGYLEMCIGDVLIDMRVRWVAGLIPCNAKEVGYGVKS